MSAATETINKRVRSRTISLRWIINAREDLLWFIGSVASSYVLLVLYVTGVVPLIPMVAGWAILIDAPHVFGTFSRTYFDASEWKTRKRLMLGSLLFFVVGPAMVLLGLGFTFFFLAALWAYYHLVKQHYGFMVLYKKKNNDLAPLDNALDRLLLMFAFNYPFVAILTIYHNLQYHRLIWFHNQKYLERGHPVRTEGASRTTGRGRSATVSEGSLDYLGLKTKYGPAALISRRLLYYIAFGILF